MFSFECSVVSVQWSFYCIAQKSLVLDTIFVSLHYTKTTRTDDQIILGNVTSSVFGLMHFEEMQSHLKPKMYREAIL